MNDLDPQPPALPDILLDRREVEQVAKLSSRTVQRLSYAIGGTPPMCSASRVRA